MKIIIKGFLPTFSILFVLAFLVSNPAFPAADAPPGKSRVRVARVNEVPVYLDQLEPLLKAESKKFPGPADHQTAEKLEVQRQKKALATFIETELLYQQALKLDVPKAEQRIAERVEQLKKYYSSQPAAGKPEEQLQELASREVYLKEYLKRQGLTDPEVQDEEIRAFYEQAKGQFVRKESVHVRHILVQITPEASAEEVEKARGRIRKARQLIVEGQPFAKVAKEYSKDNAAEAGGDIGYVQRGYMPREFEAVAFSLESQQVSEVVRTRFGFHILEVLEKVPGGPIPYSQLRDFLGRYLKEQKTRIGYLKHIEELKQQADIQILLD